MAIAKINKDVETQINLIIPRIWKEKLSTLARKKSAEDDHDYSYVDILKMGLIEHFNLPDPKTITTPSTNESSEE